MVRKAVSYLFVFAMVAASAFSTTIINTYDSKALFEAALSNVSPTINFDNLVPLLNTEKTYSTAAGYLDSSLVQFVGVNDGDYFLSVLYSSAVDYSRGSKAVLRIPFAGGSAKYTEVTLPQPVTAIGFDAMTAVPNGATFVLTFPAEYNIAPLSFSTSPVAGTRTWVSFTSSVAFSSFHIQTLSGRGMIDNFEFGQAAGAGASEELPAETPEVATLLMIGSGLVFLRFAGNRLLALAH